MLSRWFLFQATILAYFSFANDKLTWYEISETCSRTQQQVVDCIKVQESTFVNTLLVTGISYL